MTAAQVMRRRMRCSHLIGAPFATPDEAVRWHVAIQAQDYGPAKWSIAQRSSGLVDRDLDEAVASGRILRTHVLRPTWHFVARADIRWLLALTGPRVQQHNRGRYRELDLDERTLAAGRETITSALKGGVHLTRNEIAAALDDAGIDRSGQRLPYILMDCELEAVICSGARASKHHSYALLDERVPTGRRFDRNEAAVELTRRYLASHGPATVGDLRWWSGLTVTDIKQALDAMGTEVRRNPLGELTLWTLAADADPPPAARGVHLLHTYDELIVGYTESRFLGDPRVEMARRAWKERTLPTGLALRNGRIEGHWKRTIGKNRVVVVVLVHEKMPRSAERALETAADQLGVFLGLDSDLEIGRL